MIQLCLIDQGGEVTALMKPPWLFGIRRRKNMTKFEYLAVLRSMKLAIKKGTKEDVESLVDELISDAEGEKKIVKKVTKE